MRLTFTDILEDLRPNAQQRRTGVESPAREGRYGVSSAEKSLGTTGPQDAGNAAPAA